MEPGGCWSAVEAQIRDSSKISLTCDDTSILPDVAGIIATILPEGNWWSLADVGLH